MHQDEDVAEELQQCDMPISDSRAQNLATLYGIIKQHQPSSPPQQQVRLDERWALLSALLCPLLWKDTVSSEHKLNAKAFDSKVT